MLPDSALYKSIIDTDTDIAGSPDNRAYCNADITTAAYNAE